MANLTQAMSEREHSAKQLELENKMIRYYEHIRETHAKNINAKDNSSIEKKCRDGNMGDVSDGDCEDNMSACDGQIITNLLAFWDAFVDLFLFVGAG